MSITMAEIDENYSSICVGHHDELLLELNMMQY
jgi:hypothetical protein